MKNQKSPVILVIILVILLLAGVAGYMLVAKNKAPGKGLMSNIQLPGGVGLNANCKLNDPELCRFMDKSIKMADNFKTGFVGSSVITNKTGTKTESTWEIAGTSSHFVTSEKGKEQSNMIVMGDTTYTKDLSDGKWTKFTFKSSEGAASKDLFNVDEIKNQFNNTIKETEDKTTYKPLGKEACGSFMCFKYQVITPVAADIKEYVYFDDSQYVMRKTRMESSDGVTETTFDFKPVTISEPSPIKTSPSTGTFNPVQNGAASSIDATKLQEEMQKYINQSSSSEESSTSE